MGREYVVSFEKVSVSAVQDLFQIIGAAGMILEIKRFNIDCVDTTAPTNQQLALRCRFLPATVTNGSGGSSPTPQKVDNGDPAATFTAKANNTTQATTNGTASTKWEGGCNVFSGVEKYFTEPIVVGPSQAFTVELITATSGTLTLSGSVSVTEKGG